MPKRSAGILLYRDCGDGLEVFLVHPGGPFWEGKDEHAWSIPKGEYDRDEAPLDAAIRELAEETGVVLDAPVIDLGEVRQSCRKIVHAWAACQDCDAAAAISNTFTMEWPPKSGQIQEFPEVDQGAWFPAEVAKSKLHKGQSDLINRLTDHLAKPIRLASTPVE